MDKRCTCIWKVKCWNTLLVIKGMEQKENHISVKLDYKDIRDLKKTVTHMKKDLSAYPSGEELAQIAGMSPARYQLAFGSITALLPTNI